MQRVCPVAGGVKAYLADPGCLVTDATRVCPFCDDRHRLHLHDWYERWALLPDPEEPVRIPVRRLLCPGVGRTVSLLPDFCLPKRQHGPALLGRFLHAVAVLGTPLLHALRRVREDAPGHSVAQSLRDGFLARAVLLRAYLAGLRPRPPPVPSKVPARLRELAALVLGLVRRGRDPAVAFVHHARAFHAAFGTGIA